MKSLFAAMVGIAISTGASLAGPLETMDEAQVEALAQEISMKLAGAQACKIQSKLPSEDVGTILKAIGRAKPNALRVGAVKAQLIVEGLKLRPKSEACDIVGKMIDEARPTWAFIASKLRQ